MPDTSGFCGSFFIALLLCMILQKTTSLGYIPKRIVSLVPSQTELLHYLGLTEQTVGVTKFCIYPEEWFKSKTRVGGTKTINKKIIDRLKPDLIIVNKEENIKEQIELLASDFPVWLTDVSNLAEALSMISDMGKLTGKDEKATELVIKIKSAFNQISIPKQTVRSAYLIWRKPYMTIGGDTFINDMLLKCGFKNAFEDKRRYPEVNIADIQNANCQVLFLSSEPYPFVQKHINELAIQLPGCKIVLVDGEMFSWYGSRLLLSAEYFQKLIRQIHVS